MPLSKLRNLLLNWLDNLRLRLASPEAILLLSFLAVLTGLLTGLVIVLFRWLLECMQEYILLGKVDDFETLDALWRLAFPLVGAVLLAVVFRLVAHRYRQVGILHVFERLQYHQGRMPWVNMVMQFFGASVAILSGHSVGREGPGIHMGAYSGSWVAQRLQLPNNSTRTLVACGTAAAIGASFNTPLAGIIFAMEVVMQQYTVQGFVPVILAAVSGTYFSLSVLGPEYFFEIPELHNANTAADWWLAVILGVVIGLLSATFNFMLIQLTRLSTQYPLWQRFLLAGLLMGLIGWWVPQSMGIGYDTVHQTMNAQIGVNALILILAAKLAASVLCLGLGVPGGVIGPLMFVGATAGAALVTLTLSTSIAFLIPAEPGLYPLIGMGAMFGASLQAPLAGLTAVMELSKTADIILPAMLGIVSASLTSKAVFRHDSLFTSLLQARGLDHSSSVVIQRLRMIGAASMMNRSFSLCGHTLSRASAKALLDHGSQWLVITDAERQPKEMVRSLDLHSFIETHPEADSIRLQEIPGKRLQLAALSVRASLQEALDTLNRSAAEAVYLQREAGGHIYGVITRARIEKTYQ